MADLPRITLRPRVMNLADTGGDRKKQDDYIQKVVRYIPGEIVVAYTFASGLVVGAHNVPTLTVLWIVIAALGIVTPIWLFFATKIKDKDPPGFQIVVGILAYCFWVFAISGGTLFTWYNSIYGSLLLMFFTLVVPLIEKIFVRAKQKPGPVKG